MLTSGSLKYDGDLLVGTYGLLGNQLTLNANRQLQLSGTTTVAAFRNLTLDGGRLSTGDLVLNPGGTFDFIKGTLVFNAPNYLFNVGNGGQLGSNICFHEKLDPAGGGRCRLN